jgi:hypothetical protein
MASCLEAHGSLLPRSKKPRSTGLDVQRLATFEYFTGSNSRTCHFRQNRRTLHRAVRLTQSFHGAARIQNFNTSQKTSKTQFNSGLSYLFSGQAAQHVAAMLFPVFRSRFISETAWSRDIGVQETVSQVAEDNSTEPYVRMAGCAPTAAVRGMSTAALSWPGLVQPCLLPLETLFLLHSSLRLSSCCLGRALKLHTASHARPQHTASGGWTS